MTRADLRALRDQTLLTLWAMAGVAAATLAGTSHAPSPVRLSAPPVDTAFADTPTAWQATLADLAAEDDGYLRWADARYAGLRAEAPHDPALASEHATIRAELARRGLQALP